VETYLCFCIDLVIFHPGGILRCAPVFDAVSYGALPHAPPDSDLTKSSPESDPRLGFATFFNPVRSSLCVIFGAKKLRLAWRKNVGLDSKSPKKIGGCTLGYITAGCNFE
jgi:hypothetical protein